MVLQEKLTHPETGIFIYEVILPVQMFIFVGRALVSVVIRVVAVIISCDNYQFYPQQLFANLPAFSSSLMRAN